MSRSKRSLCWPAVILCVAVAACLGAQERPTGTTGEEKGSSRPQAKVTLSKETTVITEPLTEDGYPDYVAALNELAGEGVTPENNAAVLFCRASGPSPIEEELRPRFYRMLGIEQLPEQGDYIVPFDEYVNGLVGNLPADRDAAAFREKLEKAYEEAMDRPWSKDEFPEVARWLEMNEVPLELIVQGTKRPRYYTPLISSPDEDDPGMVVSVLLPILQETRTAARLLTARAMLRLDQGRTAAAWADLLATHRLARLAGQDPTLIGALVGLAIDRVALGGDAWLIHEGNLGVETLRKMSAEYQALGPLPSMAEKLNVGERFMYLDCVCTLARGRTDLFEIVGSSTSPGAKWALDAIGSVLIDWDLVLRMGNSWYDRMVEAMKKPAHAERANAMEALDDEVATLDEDFKDPKDFALSFFGGKSPRRTMSEHMGNVLAALMLPAMMAAREAEDRGETWSRLMKVGFALEKYKAANNRYPETLAELAPRYIDEMPVDLFTGEPFRYRREGDGFLIYSLGPDMEDDGGKLSWLDRDKAAPGEDPSEWDDYRLRIPPEDD